MSPTAFRYAAFDPRGAKRRGVLSAETVTAAAAQLRADGLVPIRIAATRGVPAANGRAIRAEILAEMLLTLGQLLAGGGGLTTAIALARAQAPDPKSRAFCQDLERGIASGEGVSVAFASALQGRFGFVPALIAAGEASGDLAAALRSASHQLRRDQALKSSVWSAVSYPLFILASSFAAITMLIFIVVPSLAPLVSDAGGRASLSLRILLGVAQAASASGPWLAGATGAAAMAALIAARLGLLRAPLERLILDGPLRRIARGLEFGRLAGTLGRLLAAGVAAPVAFSLAGAGVGNRDARRRLETAAALIYEGRSVADALQTCLGFPAAIVRMARIGEETGALGPMLEQAGDLEQQSAVRRIEAVAKWLGPLLIVAVGAMIGGIMAVLLSSVAGIGASVLA